MMIVHYSTLSIGEPGEGLRSLSIDDVGKDWEDNDSFREEIELVESLRSPDGPFALISPLRPLSSC